MALQAPPFDVGLVAIDPQVVVIPIHVGKNLVEDVLLDGGSSVNIIIEDLKENLGLPIPNLAPYTLRMVDQNLTKPIGLIQDLKIHIHGILYIVTFTVMKDNILDVNYSMLLGRPWLQDAKVTHD
jgi:hypothetical protein